MVKLAVQRDDPALDFQPLVHLAAGEPGAVAAKQPHQPIRVPVAMSNPTAFVKHAPRNAETAAVAGWFDLPEQFDLAAKLRRELLVGVQAENPRMSGQGQRFVFLADVTEPVLMLETAPELTNDFLGAIRAAGIEHDDFVGQLRAALQAAREILLLVERDEAEGDFHRSRAACSRTARVSETSRSSANCAAPTGGAW